MIEFIPYVLPIVLSLIIAVFVILFYIESRKFGLVFIWIAFLIVSVPSIVNLALGGPYFTLRLVEQGLGVTEVASIHFHLFLVDIAFQIVYAVLLLIGLYQLTRKTKTES